MSMIITADPNNNYGGESFVNKYSPLVNIQLDIKEEEKIKYNKLFLARENLLRDYVSYPNDRLYFYSNWDKTKKASGKDHAPPMVVISSKRAVWIREILDNAAKSPLKGYRDTTTFDNGIVPWYAPARSKRDLYIIVHWTEYDTYFRNIYGHGQQADNIFLIGYKYKGGFADIDLVGYGPLRYAAIQVMIELGHHKIWLVDDNVVNIVDFPNTLEEVEKHFSEPSKKIWGLGFESALSNQGENILRELRESLQKYNDTSELSKHKSVITVTAGMGGEASASDSTNTEAGDNDQKEKMLQQAVLLNIELFREKNINYSPLFITSHEDVGLHSYFKKIHAELKFIEYKIVKIGPEERNEKIDFKVAKKAIEKLEKRKLHILTALRSIQDYIEIKSKSDINSIPLDQFIDSKLLHNKGSKLENLLAQSQAVEQVFCLLIAHGINPESVSDPYQLGNNLVEKDKDMFVKQYAVDSTEK